MEKLTREEIEMCEIAVSQIINRLDLTPENEAKWEALFDRLDALLQETCLTPLAPDAGDSAASSGSLQASAESTSQTDPTPTQRG